LYKFRRIFSFRIDLFKDNDVDKNEKDKKVETNNKSIILNTNIQKLINKVRMIMAVKRAF